MGILSAIQGTRVYLDTNVFVYALEEHPTYAPALAELFDAIDAGTLHAVKSELALGEGLVKPFMDGDVRLQAAYQDAIRESSSLHVAAVSRQVLVGAARVRAENPSIKLPDAIHDATAQQEACDTFLTNDVRLRQLPGLHVVLCSEAIAE